MAEVKIASFLKAFQRILALEHEVVEGCPVFLDRSRRKAVVVGLPLWRRDDAYLNAEQTRARSSLKTDMGFESVAFTDLFELSRAQQSVFMLLDSP